MDRHVLEDILNEEMEELELKLEKKCIEVELLHKLLTHLLDDSLESTYMSQYQAMVSRKK